MNRATIDKALVSSFIIDEEIKGPFPNEPTIRQMIYKYYRYTGVGMHPIDASNCTTKLIEAFLNQCVGENDV